MILGATHPEHASQPLLVKPNYHFVADKDHRVAHLTALCDHLFASIQVLGNIIFDERNTVYAEKLPRGIAELTVWSRVKGDAVQSTRWAD
jgi:hypothetical protein